MNFDKLKNLMDIFVESKVAPGNTIAININGERVFDYSCGFSDVFSGKKMTGDEFFNLYSLSKITTVTAALQLLEKGVFLLNDPLCEYIPEYKNMYVKNKNGSIKEAKNKITILNLFNMTAGFNYDMDTSAFEETKRLTNGKMNTETLVRCLAKEPLSFEPGTDFQYSLCHDVLAGLVEIVSGKKFRDYVKENIFEPLGMNESCYHLKPGMEERFARQYNYADENMDNFIDVGIENSMIPGEEFDSGGAGVISTVTEYMKLVDTLCNYGTSRGGERILSKQSVELLRTDSLDAKQFKSFDYDHLKGYSYGLGVRTMVDRIAGSSLGNIGEFGWDGAAGSVVYIDPKIGLSVVYGKHILAPRPEYYQPRLRNVIYSCL